MRGVRPDNQTGGNVMNDKEILQILCKAQSRMTEAWQMYMVDDLDGADKEISELRDVLDDICDRQEEGIIEPGTLDHR